MVGNARLSGPPHGDRFQVLGTHDAANTTPTCRPRRGMNDTGILDEIFSSRPNVERLEAPVPKFLQDCPVKGVRPHAFEFFGVADFHLSVIDHDIAELIGLSCNHDSVIACKSDFGAENPPTFE